MESFVATVALLFSLPALTEAFECLQGCGFNKNHPLVAPRTSADLCLVTLPDNPRRNATTHFPCQIEIRANCSGFCQVHLEFFKFNLQPCAKNLTEFDDVCSQINSCEYVVLREHGVDEGGVPLDDVTRFHGDLTRDVFVSRSDSVLLQFCYRSETFSARNIAITYKAINPSIATPRNYGPASVYVLGTFVVLFIIAIFMVQWCPWLRPCLDPVPQKESLMMDL